jgi:hypothetical protein
MRVRNSGSKPGLDQPRQIPVHIVLPLNDHAIALEDQGSRRIRPRNSGGRAHEREIAGCGNLPARQR